MQNGKCAGSRQNSLDLGRQPANGMNEAEEKAVEATEKLPAHENGK